ncbi:MAG TPA: hypothetical protein VFH29_02880, partial [Anaerolineales bacterium]|nr:hypothetical protein [Anaerolineales bacterium]
MGALGNQVTSTRTLTPSWLFKASAAAALGEGILLLIGLLPLLTPTAFPDNWLITIFKLHAGFSGAHLGLLMGLNLLDVAILGLEGLAILGLAAALWATSRLGSIIAAIQPLLGIALFLVTQNAGR